MPASLPAFKTRTNTSPIARRVLSHPRNEVRQSSKLGRVSTLYDQDTGMLNSQLTDTQWAVNIGLEATQDQQALFTSTPVKTEVLPFHISSPPFMDHEAHAQAGKVKKEEPDYAVFQQLPRNPLLELPPIFHLPSTPVKTEAVPARVPLPPLMKHKNRAGNVKKEEPISPIPAATSLELPPVFPGSPISTSSPTLNDISAPALFAEPVKVPASANTSSVAIDHQMLLSLAERMIIENIRELSEALVAKATGDMKEVESERDLLRLELARREKYILSLQSLLADRGISPPSSPIMQSQKAYFHFTV
ncbi:hypothetical protein FB446DRAFT_708734 [Lentinula raphanica]|nr:hypothetical protein FB446DRAFT_708734 [Lentinula raphanica]